VLRRARWALGSSYAKLYDRVAPRSARDALRLPVEPRSRRFGLEHGRAIDRVYIEAFLERHAADVHGAVLEVFESSYTERHGGAAVTRSDVLDAVADNPRATVVGNLETGEGLPSEVFDCFICTQTLSYSLDPAAELRNAHDLLRPGGVLLLSVPCISHQSAAGMHPRFPDLQRLMPEGLARLLEESPFAEHAVEAHGTLRAAAAFLYGLSAEQIDPEWLAPYDPDYPMVACARAVRASP
jgi:SAM-dependent methyltransferase